MISSSEHDDRGHNLAVPGSQKWKLWRKGVPMRTTSCMPETSVQELVQPEAVKKYADLIFDVVLHVGEDAGFYLRKGFRVIALEANPDLCKLCQKQVSEGDRLGSIGTDRGSD